MVNGPGVCICESCIKTCSDILKEQMVESGDDEFQDLEMLMGHPIGRLILLVVLFAYPKIGRAHV